MTFRCRVPISIAALTLLIEVVAVSAQTPTPQPGIQELIQRAVQQSINGQPPTAPESPATAESDLPLDARPIVALSLDDVVRLALDRNLTIAVQRLNPPQFDPAIASLRATYWPQVSSLLGTQSTADPPTAGTIGIPVGAASVTSGVTTLNGGYGQNIPWGGGQLNVAINNLKNTTTSTTALYNPAYLPSYAATFTQRFFGDWRSIRTDSRSS